MPFGKRAHRSSRQANYTAEEGGNPEIAAQLPDMLGFRLYASACLYATQAAGVLRGPFAACHPFSYGLGHASLADLSAADLTGIG